MDEEIALRIADVFKIFGDKTRIRIMSCLIERERCVDEIAEEIGMEQSAISHQLKVLKRNKLVKSKKEGRFSYYSLDDDHVKTILQMGRSHALEER